MGTRAGTEERVGPEVVGPLGMGLELHVGMQGAYDNYRVPTVGLNAITHALCDSSIHTGTVRGPTVTPYKRWKASKSAPMIGAGVLLTSTGRNKLRVRVGMAI